MPNLRVALELNAEDLATPNIRRVISQVEKLQQASERLNNPQAGRGAGASGMLRLSRDTQQAQQSMSTFQQILQNAFGIAGGIGIADVIASIVAGLVSVSAGAIRANSSLERMQVTLRAFTRDPGLADTMATMLRGNADTTPFGTAEVMGAGTQLVPIARTTEALERAVKLAEMLATLAPEQGLSGATFALREAAAGDYLSLQERQNIPRNLINQLKTEGYQGIDLVAEALQRMGVGMDLVNKQGQTFEGRLSTLASALQELGRVAGSASFQTLSTHLDRASENLAENRPQLTQAAQAAGEVLGELLDEHLGTWEQGVRDFGGFVEQFVAPFRTGRASATALAGSAVPALMDLFAQSGLWTPGQPNPVMDPVLQQLAELRARMRAADAAVFGDQSRGFAQVGTDMFDPTHVQGFSASTARTLVAFRSLNAAEESGRQGQIERQSEYLRALNEADQVSDGVLVRNARRINQIADTWTRATEQVNAYEQRLQNIGTASGVVDRLLNPMLAARSLARRTGTYGGEFDAAILDLKTRGYGLTRQEGLAALQDYLARRYDEQVSGSFFSTEQVNLQAQVVNINGQGGGQMSTVSGSGQGANVTDMISRRYENSRGAWPWAAGVGGALHR